MAKNNHSTYYMLVKQKWENGEWNERMLRALVSAGRITDVEFAEITGIAY